MNEEPFHSTCLSAQMTDCVEALKARDVELAYLALLTREGLKPLSRWERPLDEPGLALLGRMGLIAREVHRTVRTGKEVVETIFAISPAAIGVYERAFSGRPVDKSAATVRMEGFLFGYPPCCIEQYIKHPYAPNDQPDEDRKILFHWACQGCRITPLLLPAYAKVYAAVKNG